MTTPDDAEMLYFILWCGIDALQYTLQSDVNRITVLFMESTQSITV